MAETPAGPRGHPPLDDPLRAPPLPADLRQARPRTVQPHALVQRLELSDPPIAARHPAPRPVRHGPRRTRGRRSRKPRRGRGRVTRSQVNANQARHAGPDYSRTTRRARGGAHRPTRAIGGPFETRAEQKHRGGWSVSPLRNGRPPGRDSSASGERHGTSNSSVLVIAPASGRAGTGVRSARLENCTASSVGLPALSQRCHGRDVHRHGSRGRGRDPSPCSSRCSPAAPTRCSFPTTKVLELKATVDAGVSGSTQLNCAQRRRATSLASPPFPRVDRQPVIELDGDDALADVARIHRLHASVSVVRIGRPAHASCAGSSRSTPSG